MLGRGQRAFVGAVVVMTVASGLAVAEEQSPPATQPPAAQEAAAPQQPAAPQDTAAQQAATPASAGTSAPPAIQPESSPPSQQQGVVAHVDPSPAAEAPPVNPSEPDPLTPAEVVTPPPAAPGAAPAAAVAQKPAAELNPVIVEARRKLAAEAKAGNAGDATIARISPPSTKLARANPCGSVPTVSRSAPSRPWRDQARRPVGLEPVSLRAAGGGRRRRIRGSARRRRHQGQASPSQIRPARARWAARPANPISRIIDQKPQVYDPRSVMDAIAAYDGADAYLRSLHPKHPLYSRNCVRPCWPRVPRRRGRADAADIKRVPRSSASPSPSASWSTWRLRWLPANLLVLRLGHVPDNDAGVQGRSGRAVGKDRRRQADVTDVPVLG